MDIQSFLSIGIVGAALSFVLEWINKELELGNLASKGVAIVASFIVGTAYFFVASAPYADSVFGILVGSTVVWAFLLNNGKKVN